jgi:tRNA/rRNA methyltransferase
MSDRFDVNVVLVRTIYDSNIGAASRAMSNMGGTRLILIDPKCDITIKAHQAAASGQQALENRIVYKNWTDYYNSEEAAVHIAFTAKAGRMRQVREFDEVLSWLSKNDSQFLNSNKTIRINLIFGPEDWGLSNEDVFKTNFNVCIPTYGNNSSLNLAQAVLLALFQFRQKLGGERTFLEGNLTKRAHTEDLNFEEKSQLPYDLIKDWLTEMGFQVNSDSVNVYTVMTRLFLHNVPNKKEIKILTTILQQSRRKLRLYNEMRKSKSIKSQCNDQK